MQLLAKFKKIMYMGFRATLIFRKFKVARNPMYVLESAGNCFEPPLNTLVVSECTDDVSIEGLNQVQTTVYLNSK